MTIEDNILTLLRQKKQLTIQQLAEILQKDLPYISKRIKMMEQKGLVQKNNFSTPGSRIHSKIITLSDDYFVEDDIAGDTDNLSAARDPEIKKCPYETWLSCDSPKCYAACEVFQKHNLTQDKLSTHDQISDLSDSLTDVEKEWLRRRIFSTAFAKKKQNGKFPWAIAESIIKKLKLLE